MAIWLHRTENRVSSKCFPIFHYFCLNNLNWYSKNLKIQISEFQQLCVLQSVTFLKTGHLFCNFDKFILKIEQMPGVYLLIFGQVWFFLNLMYLFFLAGAGQEVVSLRKKSQAFYLSLLPWRLISYEPADSPTIREDDKALYFQGYLFNCLEYLYFDVIPFQSCFYLYAQFYRTFMTFNHGGCFIYCHPSTFMKMFQKFIKTFYTLLLTGPNLPALQSIIIKIL